MSGSLISINSGMITGGRQSIFVNIALMGKKTQADSAVAKVLTTREHLRRSSITLQRHIFHRNSLAISRFIEQNISKHLISYNTHDKYMDLLRETKKETQNRSEQHDCSDTSDKDSEEMRKQIHKEQSLPNEFEALLDKSLTSYERTSDLFKRMSLVQRFGHLVGLEDFEQQKSDVQELSEHQTTALKKIRLLYRRYKVSNMYKSSITSRIRKRYIEKLIEKGYLREKNQIISLTA